ncbi:MAG: helix-turn-helix domain-containing protein [Candidatus Anammoximicrobium sp.]|nr:helix-turn-helix domain-containing protein [Candidatus Anammoximicrobium sp.]
MTHSTPTTSTPQDLTTGIVPELLTTKQAAELASVGERTWWSWTRSGLAPRPLQIGHGTRPAVRYRRSDIMAWIASGCPRVDGKGGNGQ